MLSLSPTYKSTAARRLAQRAAAAAAELAIRKLQSEVARYKRQHDLLVESVLDPEVRRRLCIVAPALASLLAGQHVKGPQALMRNVALHAACCPDAAAPLAEWRHAQRGLRLDRGKEWQWNVDALPFVPKGAQSKNHTAGGMDAQVLKLSLSTLCEELPGSTTAADAREKDAGNATEGIEACEDSFDDIAAPDCDAANESARPACGAVFFDLATDELDKAEADFFPEDGGTSLHEGIVEQQQPATRRMADLLSDPWLRGLPSAAEAEFAEGEGADAGLDLDAPAAALKSDENESPLIATMVLVSMVTMTMLAAEILASILLLACGKQAEREMVDSVCRSGMITGDQNPVCKVEADTARVGTDCPCCAWNASAFGKHGLVWALLLMVCWRFDAGAAMAVAWLWHEFDFNEHSRNERWPLCTLAADA